MRRIPALYLGCCHTWGWTPSDDGLRAFVQQIINGLRLPDGRMFWQEDTKCDKALVNTGSGS